MKSQPGLQTIAIIKFGQLIDYNKKNIFPQKFCGKWSKETSSRPLFIS